MLRKQLSTNFDDVVKLREAKILYIYGKASRRIFDVRTSIALVNQSVNFMIVLNEAVWACYANLLLFPSSVFQERSLF